MPYRRFDALACGVLALYLACLAAGLGLMFLQVLAGHDGHLGGHDVHDAAGHESTALSALASLRFWSFALLAFGFVGSALTGFELVPHLVTLLVALGAGGTSGAAITTAMRRLAKQNPQSLGSHAELVGRTARVVVPIENGGPGKVRVDLRGTYVDVVARSDDARETLECGALVVLEEAATPAGGAFVVSRAPAELE